METTAHNPNARQWMALSQHGASKVSMRPAGDHPPSGVPSAELKGDSILRVVTLRPRPLLWLRKSLMCGWCGYLLLSNCSPSFKLDLCLIGLAVLGTFRTTRVSLDQIEWSYRFAFMPFYRRRLSLQDHSSILTGWEETSGLGEALLLGLWGMCLAPLADWICPWPGGSYRLWVKNSQGQRTLVWRGRVPKTFYRNHKLLSEVTELPSQRMAS